MSVERPLRDRLLRAGLQAAGLLALAAGLWLARHPGWAVPAPLARWLPARSTAGPHLPGGIAFGPVSAAVLLVGAVLFATAALRYPWRRAAARGHGPGGPRFRARQVLALAGIALVWLAGSLLVATLL